MEATNQIVITLESIHLVLIIVGIIIGFGIQIGIILYWKHTINEKIEMHEERIKILENYEMQEDKVLKRIEYNLKRLFVILKHDYIEVD